MLCKCLRRCDDGQRLGWTGLARCFDGRPEVFRGRQIEDRQRSVVLDSEQIGSFGFTHAQAVALGLFE